MTSAEAGWPSGVRSIPERYTQDMAERLSRLINNERGVYQFLHTSGEFAEQTRNQQMARLFAADCAEQVAEHANDPEVAKFAIRVARRGAFGVAERDEIKIVGGIRVTDDAIEAAFAAAFLSDNAATVAGYRAAEAAIDAYALEHGVVRHSKEAQAAGEEEREWQANRLLAYLAGNVDIEAIKESAR